MLRCKRVFKWLKQVGKDFEFFADFFRFKKSIPDKVDLQFFAPRIGPAFGAGAKDWSGLGGNLPRPPKLLVSQLQRDTTQPLIPIVLHIYDESIGHIRIHANLVDAKCCKVLVRIEVLLFFFRRTAEIARAAMPIEKSPARNGDLPVLLEGEEIRLSEPKTRCDF